MPGRLVVRDRRGGLLVDRVVMWRFEAEILRVLARDEIEGVPLTSSSRTGMRKIQRQSSCLRMFADEAEANHFLTESRELRTGHLRVGAVGLFHVTEMLVAFHARYPGVTISFSVGNSHGVLQDLLEYRTDVAVLAYVESGPRLWVPEYSRDEIVVFGRRDHPLFASSRSTLSLRELDGQAVVSRELGSNTRRKARIGFPKAFMRYQ